MEKSFPQEKIDPSRGLFHPKVEFAQCPIKCTLGVLGKKWTMLILRDIGFRRIDRFNRLLESVPGLTPRVLSNRLKELEKEGFIECIEYQKSPMIVRWTLTPKGSETLPILMRFIAFGSKWHADEVFEDKIPRTLPELFRPEALEIMLGYEENPVDSRIYPRSTETWFPESKHKSTQLGRKPPLFED